MDPKEIIQAAIQCMISNLNLQKIAKNNDIPNFMNRVSDLLDSNNLENTSILKTFKQSMHCISCQTNLYEVVLDCNHQYCNSCIVKIIEDDTDGLIITNKYEKNLTPKCILCNKVLKVVTFKHFFKDS